jgi:predicted site-specific integrase-resolvase
MLLMTLEYPRLMTRSQVLEATGISRADLESLVDEGKLDPVRITKQRKYRRMEIEQLMERLKLWKTTG